MPEAKNRFYGISVNYKLITYIIVERMNFLISKCGVMVYRLMKGRSSAKSN